MCIFPSAVNVQQADDPVAPVVKRRRRGGGRSRGRGRGHGRGGGNEGESSDARPSQTLVLDESTEWGKILTQGSQDQIAESLAEAMCTDPILKEWLDACEGWETPLYDLC